MVGMNSRSQRRISGSPDAAGELPRGDPTGKRSEWASCIRGLPARALLIDAHGLVQAANVEALRFLGIPRSQVLGRSVTQILPGFRPPAQGGITRITIPHPESHFRSSARAGGQLEVHARRLRIAGGWRTIALLHDVAPRPCVGEQDRTHLASLVRMVPVGIRVSGAEGSCLSTNPAWRRMTGLSRSECLGDGWLRAVHTQDRPAMKQAWRRLQSGSGTLRREYRIVRPDGGIRWIAARVIPFHGVGGRVTGFLNLDEDVTFRQEADTCKQLAIGVSSLLGAASMLTEVVPRLLQVIAEGLGTDVGEFWACDTRGDRLRVEHVWHAPSRRLSAFVRHSRTLDVPLFDGMPGRVLKSKRAEWVPHLDRAVPFLRGRQAAEAGLCSALALPVPFHGRVVGVMAFLGRSSQKPSPGLLRLVGAVTRQIGEFMERERTAAALRASEASLRRAQAMVGLGSYEQPLESGRRTAWSPEVISILGLPPNSPPLTHKEVLMQVVHPDDRPRVRELVLRALRGRQPFDIQCRILRPDGAIRHVQTCGNQSPGRRGGARSIVGTLWDITERKELQRDILEASEREQRRIGRDLHDGLGQRLTALELFSHSLATDLGPADPRLADAARRMNQELRAILVQTRLLSHGLSPVPLETDGLARALRELAAGVTGLSQIRCDLELSRPVAVSDSGIATHLYRIAQEAVNNALRHAQPTQILIRLHRLKSRVELTITDNGRGLPRSSDTADGIGLRVMQFRADLIGATLSLESSPGRGTRVHCVLRKAS